VTTSQERDQAAYLAELTANAMAAARSRLSQAAAAAEAVDKALHKGEADIAELPGRANQVRYAEEPQPHLRNAQGIADNLDDWLRRRASELDEARDHVDVGARAIMTGRQSLGELEELPGQRTEATEQLRQRLDGLDRAVRTAGEGIDRTTQLLRQARTSVEPLLYAAGSVNDRDRTAAMITDVGSDLDSKVGKARGELRTLSEDLDGAQPNANVAAWQSEELATALRAGMNPTPQSAQRTSDASSEQDRHRADAPARTPHLDL
jgi:hypothetical protein